MSEKKILHLDIAMEWENAKSLAFEWRRSSSEGLSFLVTSSGDVKAQFGNLLAHHSFGVAKQG